ncbi:MAG: hypothetical protein SWH54_01745 [Thermodesulfobacteriota bacterium]|nr:hypothetical protein [Thermodesulfobacteriota bacterium]
MELFAGNISHMIFKVNVNLDMGKISLNARMLDVLYALDGSRDIDAVSRFLKMNMHDLRAILHKLYQQNLIVKVEKAVPMLDSDFINLLQSKLAEIMGPIANTVIKDVMRRMAVSPTSVPVNRAAELIDILSAKIPVDDKKKVFRKAMLAKSVAKG